MLSEGPRSMGHCLPRTSSRSPSDLADAPPGPSSITSEGVMGAEGYGDRGYEESALPRPRLGRVLVCVLVKAANWTKLLAVRVLPTLATGGGGCNLGDRGSSKSVTTGEAW